ncbi:two component transcriptional regulator, AraC family [Ruminiclostridium papyrosolvens DSM 2782]|uniref:Stage 0 sporulation protein A homolog n=1 Tax=Ruminiclostridium papyrosolvens DSM 2782 TaxID=588581 RepID=F1T8P3_9FIRM|nr:response regulator [Ruminiclostridium papyrosolvens]EGD48875.1 two component transcriptional regulator, AraC family [Ruminiclostridium papyrosolvens DSM 2782]WES35360.1 response regulator [Ruminiclostridium papyrosolvens DSM 2782]
MYKVFLVDDEVIVRHGIRDCIKWEQTDFVFSGEAPDGEFALPLIMEIKPDILITDIKMPFMDGLELSQVVRKNMPWVKIIILSGHDEFGYAREAMRIGVTEYLLKPVTAQDLLESLEKVKDLIINEKRERENAEKIRKQLAENAPLFRDKFLSELLLGMVPPVEVIDNCESLDINIISKFYIVEILELETPKKNASDGEYTEVLQAEALIDSIVSKNSEIIKFRRMLGEIIVIIKGDNLQNIEEAAYSLAQSFKYEVERKTSCILGISIGGARERIQGITQSFKEADEIKNYRYIYGKRKILGINDIKSDMGSKKDFIKIDMNNTYEFLKCGLKSDVGSFVDKFIDNLNEIEMKSPMYIHYLFMDVVISASRFVEELGGEIETLLPWVSNLESFVAGIDSIEKFGELTEYTLKIVLEFRDTRVERKYDSIIKKAKEYIHSNFANSNISLISVASYVNVSPSHFSTIFSQEAGENFIEYLTKVRVKKAMELLKTTSLKSSEIAYNVGYNDPHYFCYIFKKATGITPKEYRSET